MSDVRFTEDGAEGIAFWVSDDDIFEYNVPVMFEDLPRLKAFLEEEFPGVFTGEVEDRRKP